MSDVPETPDTGAVEAAQGAVDPQVEAPTVERPVMPDGWTGEFDPHRAKATIDRLREFEREVNGLRSDPDAFARFAAEHHGFEIAEDEPEPEYSEDTSSFEDDPLAREVAELKQWRDEQQLERTTREINDHIADLAKESGLDLTPQEQEYIFAKAVSGGSISPQQTQRAFEAHKEWISARENAWQERYLQSKRAPDPPQEGKAGEPQIDPWDSDARVARLAALMTGEGS